MYYLVLEDDIVVNVIIGHGGYGDDRSDASVIPATGELALATKGNVIKNGKIYITNEEKEHIRKMELSLELKMEWIEYKDIASGLIGLDEDSDLYIAIKTECDKLLEKINNDVKKHKLKHPSLTIHE